MAILHPGEDRTAWQDRVASGRTRRMVDGLSGPPSWFVRRRIDKALAIALAAPTHLVTLGFAAAAGFLLVSGDTIPLRILGVVALLAAVATRPRLPQRPEHTARLGRDEAPALFEVIDRVAAAVGTRAPHEVLVVPEFNAFAGRIGLRRRVLGLGAPLWVAGEPGVRLFLLGHELGHFAQHDVSRTLVVHGAFETLGHWYDVLEDARSYPAGGLVLVPVQWLISGYAFALLYLAMPSHRRSEFLADLASVRAVGTGSGIRGLELMLARSGLDVAANRAAVDPSRPSLVGALRTAADRDDVVRRADRATGALEKSRVDDSHPQTVERLRLLESRTAEEGVVTVDDDEWARMDAELAPHVEAALRDLGDLYRHVW